MKKIIITATAMLLFASSYSQTSFKGFDLGVQVAINNSYIRGLTFSETEETNSVWRPGIFLFGTKSIGQDFYIKPGIGLNFKGGEITDNDTYEDWEGNIQKDNYIDRYKISMLELPVLVGYNVSEKIMIEGGISLGFILSATDDFDYTSTEYISDNDSGSEDFSRYLKGQELGFHIGAKYALNSKFAGGLRYFSGSDLNKAQIFTKITLSGLAFYVEMKI
jgi:hypothetical protein